MEGSRFYPNPVCMRILETPRLSGGRVQAGGSRERLLTYPQPAAIHFASYQCSTIRPNRIVGRFREPPARQRLRHTTVACTISSGCGQRSKAAPLQGGVTGPALSRVRESSDCLGKLIDHHCASMTFGFYHD